MNCVVKKIFQLNPNYNKRVFGLDLMRALAIIFVVLGHGLMLEKAETKFPWIKLINGVELFFVLSGFLIGGILLRTFEQSNSFDFKELKRFWIRRWLRTLPNYYLILLLNVVVVYLGIIKGDISQFNWKFLFFLQNFFEPFTDFFWESWSITIEEWFYILFPIILLILSKVTKRYGIEQKKIFLTSILIFLSVPILLRIIVAASYDVDEFWLGVRIYKVVIFRLDGIALGIFAAYIKHCYPDLWFNSRNFSFIFGIVLSYLIIYSSWLPNNFSTKVVYTFIQGLGCFLLLPKFDSIKKAPKLLTKIVTHISLISYSMYLINLALVAEVLTSNFPPKTAPEAWLLYLAYWVIVVVFSTILYKFFEKPIMDYREKMHQK